MKDHFGNKEQLIELMQGIAGFVASPMSQEDVEEIKESIRLDLAGFLRYQSAGVTPYFGKKFYSITNRWLRFDPTNKKGVIIKAYTGIKKPNGNYKVYDVDTHIDLTSQVSTGGTDYFLFLNDDESVSAVTDKDSGTGTYFGRFHTLCVNAGTLTMTAPASPSSGITVGDDFLVKPYLESEDPDFYDFYTKEVTLITIANKYDLITCEHPLTGFNAGDILPESIFCESFCPDTLKEDAMVYDKSTDIAVDIYMQSGTGTNTTSKYNQTHTINREPANHIADLQAVGKKPLHLIEFESAALGSNEGSVINGVADATTVGGHSDTNSRRMISAIGCEECCGYLWQWLADISSPGSGTNDSWSSARALSDGQGYFGKTYWVPYVAVAGGCWDETPANVGSRSSVFAGLLSDVANDVSCRGSSKLKSFE